MIHRFPTPWLLEARRRGEKLRANAALLTAASSTLVVISLYGVVLACVITDGIIPRIASATPILPAIGLAALARRGRRRADGYEREMERLISGFWKEERREGRRRHHHLRPVPGPETGRPGMARTQYNGER